MYIFPTEFSMYGMFAGKCGSRVGRSGSGGGKIRGNVITIDVISQKEKKDTSNLLLETKF